MPTDNADTSIDKALTILEALETNTGSRSLAAVVAATGIPKPTAHRTLAILEHRGYVRQEADRSYMLGPKVISLGRFAGDSDALITVSQPILDRLVATCRETIHLGVLVDGQLLYIDRREPKDAAVRLSTLPSPLTSLSSSAAGKVLLAFGDSSLLKEVLRRGLPQLTSKSIVDPSKLRAQLKKIAADGYAVNEQERFDGVRAVAVPVRDSRGHVVAALSVAGPVQRLDDERLVELRNALLVESVALSKALPRS
jgi:DNA-binding IclR family transcriptional regulator